MPLDFQPKSVDVPAEHHRLEVTAEGLGRYTIDVSLPIGYEKGDAKYPVVLITDGNIAFDMLQVQVHGSFAKQSPMLPPCILVGVGYPSDEGSASWYGRRNHDFMGPWEMSDPLGNTPVHVPCGAQRQPLRWNVVVAHFLGGDQDLHVKIKAAAALIVLIPQVRQGVGVSRWPGR